MMVAPPDRGRDVRVRAHRARTQAKGRGDVVTRQASRKGQKKNTGRKAGQKTGQKVGAGGQGGPQGVDLHPSLAAIVDRCYEIDDHLVHFKTLCDVRLHAREKGKGGIEIIKEEIAFIDWQLEAWLSEHILAWHSTYPDMRTDEEMLTPSQREALHLFCTEILRALCDYLCLGVCCEEAVSAALDVLDIVGVWPVAEGMSEQAVRLLFSTHIGTSACNRDHYKRVETALGSLWTGEISEDGTFRAMAVCLMAQGLLQDADIDSGPAFDPREDHDDEPWTQRDIPELLRMRGRIIGTLAGIVVFPEMSEDVKTLAATIALGYIGRTDVDRELVLGTYAHILAHFGVFVRVETLDVHFLASQFLSCCRREGLDTSGAHHYIHTRDRVKAFVTSIANVIVDEHGDDLARGESGYATTCAHAAVFEDALKAARRLNAHDWERVRAFVAEPVLAPRLDPYCDAEARQRLVRETIAEVCSHVLEERRSDQQTLDPVLETALTATPSRRYHNGTPVLAYLFERYGREGREVLERRLSTERSWWLKRFDRFEATHDPFFVHEALAETDESGYPTLEVIGELSRRASQDFVAEYLPRIHVHMGRRTSGHARTYGGIPDTPDGMGAAITGAFRDEDSQELLTQFAVDACKSPYKLAAEALNKIVHLYQSVLRGLLTLSDKALRNDVFFEVVTKAFHEEALETVAEQVGHIPTGQHGRDNAVKRLEKLRERVEGRESERRRE